MRWAAFWAILSQTHLVTLSAPAAGRRRKELILYLVSSDGRVWQALLSRLIAVIIACSIMKPTAQYFYRSLLASNDDEFDFNSELTDTNKFI
jgi:hypothetical protein